MLAVGVPTRHVQGKDRIVWFLRTAIQKPVRITKQTGPLSSNRMASLPSVAAASTLKLEPADSRRHPHSSLPTQKGPNLSYQRSQAFTQFDAQEALYVLTESSRIDTFCYVPVLHECIDRNSPSGAQMIHAHIIKTGSHQDLFVTAFLVNVYAKCGTMESAQKVFDHLPGRSVIAWTALMTGYVHSSQPEVAIRVFLEMLELGSYPTNYTLGIALNACSGIRSIELGKQIHAYAIKYRVEHDASVGNSVSSLYTKTGRLDLAIKAFHTIREKNVISWTTIVSGCGENGKPIKGLRFFIDMLAEDVTPNEYTLTSAFSMCCTMQALRIGAQLHSLCIRLGYESNIHIKNSVMYLYFKCGYSEEAEKLFSRMETMSFVTWNAMIAGHAEVMEAKDNIPAYHSGIKALDIFSKLNLSSTKPDSFTFSSILTVCSRLVALQQGEQFHAQVLKTGHLADMIVGTALVTMYSKCGSVTKAHKAFVEMSQRALVSWTSMITGFSQNGQTQQVLQLFEDMRLAGVRPNEVTFVGVLSACSHKGMVNEAIGYFEMMKQVYKIVPVMDHYECLISMFVRLGRLDGALDLIKKMDLPPSEFIWSLMLAGCLRHGNKEMGLLVAESLLESEPKDAETCALLLHILTSEEKWEDVSRVKQMLRSEKLDKPVDWSWISVKDKVHSFKSKDQSDICESGQHQTLQDLLDKAKANGYEPQPSFEQIDEDTSSARVHHSEKLAVAFGLVNTPNGAAIRINKSVAMCRDCHDFFKVISRVSGRKIIVRDSKLLHKFVAGQCSCGDYGGLL